MKRLVLILAMVSLVGLLPGCCHQGGCPTGGLLGRAVCKEDRCRRCGLRAPLRGRLLCGGCATVSEAAAYNGPPTAGVAYPYYTLHGPRDFLAPNPPSIGP